MTTQPPTEPDVTGPEVSRPEVTETEVTGTAGLDWPEPDRAVGLNQPRRAVVAGLEVVLVAVLVWVTFRLFDQGTQPLAKVAERPDLDFEHFAGNWLGAAVGAATVAGLLLLDAGRQLALAVRTRA
ncbi:hypothetical protein [Actinokineospora inagensis]|uniref:hypothetical protein n=1 Tax=Actinokineospora inagensis TaxID=103730 RepID=UPI0004037FDE|nr:hypothetical protein [Actinokineospora inagensis]